MMNLLEKTVILEYLNSMVMVSSLIIFLLLYFIYKEVLYIKILVAFVVEIIIFCYIFKNSIGHIYLVCIMINLFVLKTFGLNKLKFIMEEVESSKKRLKINNKSIIKTNNKLKQEHKFQEKYKVEVETLNEKITKSISLANIPIFILDSKEKYIGGNSEFDSILDCDEKQFDINKYFRNNFINGDDALIYLKNKDKNINEGINIESLDGRIYRFICVLDNINNKNITLCILNDITQSTFIENQLKNSEARYRYLMDILNDGVVIHDGVNISYINSKAKELFNIEDSSCSINSIKDKLYNSSLNKFNENINTVKYSEKSKSINKIKVVNGKILEVITTKLNLNNNEMLLTLTLNITDIENFVEELDQSKKTYKLLLQNIPDGIMIINRKTNNYTYRNIAMIKILKEIGIDILNKHIKSYIRNKNHGRFKKLTINKESEYDFSFALIYMEKEDNYLVVVRKVKYENKVEKIAERLIEVKEKYRFNTEFLSSVTKDLKKPIYEIDKFNISLEKNQSKYNLSYVKNYNKLVRQNCYRLMRLLNNIEKIDRIDNGDEKVDLQVYNVVKLTSDIVNLARTYTNKKCLELEFECEKKEILIEIDKVKFERVVLNILSNAIKFTKENGKIKVFIKVVNNEVLISIEDTGVGIAKNKIDMVFENFEQIDRTLSRGAEGTGIGLTLVKKFVQVQGGKINLKSELGIGSNFELIFKLYEGNERKIKLNKKSIRADKEMMDIEFSDIYFNSNI